MKNKQAKQMMLDCNSEGFALQIAQSRISSQCAKLKNAGIYNPMLDLRSITYKELSKISKFTGFFYEVDNDAEEFEHGAFGIGVKQIKVNN